MDRSRLVPATLLGASLALAGVPAATGAAPQAPPAIVTTFAGSGVAGNRDGALAAATFSAPSSIAVAPNGDVYVADRALDTLRLIHDGVVTTVVGRTDGDPVWRPGGYRDGPGAEAQLKHPDGIAAAPDGSIVIADSWNACVRRYKDGVVTTIAGSPLRFGHVDGDALAQAAFHNPTAVAVDANGAIYVSDRDNPVRKIANGTVTSLDLKTSGLVLGLATAPPDKLFVADEAGLLETNTVPGTPGLRLTNTETLHERATTESGAPLGHPSALAAVDGHAVAYADLTDDSIHVAVVTRVERIAGVVAADPNEAGGYRNGPPLQARFNAPSGIARYGDGWLVADTGNHAIRYVPGVDTRNAVSPDDVGELDGYVTHKRTQLVVIGNSEVWFDTNYRESVAGRLQPLEPAFDVVPVSMVGVDDPSLVGNWLADAYDLKPPAQVVYVFNDAGITDHNQTPYATLATGGAWTAKLTAQLADLRAKCAGAKLVVVDIPIGLEASPNEAALEQRVYTSTSSEWEHINAVHALAAAAARKSGVRYVDLWPAFRAIDAAGHGPLYHEFDTHLSANGRARLADLIAEALR